MVILTALVGLMAPSLRAAPFPGADEKWKYLKSENFEVYSRNSESDSRQILYNLELVHAIFFQSYGFKPVRAVPITVYFFSRDKYFEAYKSEIYRKADNIASVYQADPDRGILTMAPLPTYEVAQQLAFGAYAYHLFRLMDEKAPTWYAYGMSSLLRNLQISSSTLELGRPDSQQVSRLQTARLIPVEAMLATDQTSGTFMANQGNYLFHDESWAMVHYLYFGDHKLPRQGVSEFVSYAMSTRDRFDAATTRSMFEKCLGITYEKFNTDLERYFRQGRYSYAKTPLPTIAPAKSYAIRPVPLAEINLRLAELALRTNRSPLGKLALLEAIERQPDNARFQEALAAEAVKEGDWDSAAERWNKALDAGSTNPSMLHELAQYEGRRRFREFDLYYRMPEETATRLRDLLARSIAAAPRQTAAYEIMAWVEATSQEPMVKNINLVQEQFPRLKERKRTLLALAVLHMRVGDKPGALEMLDNLDKSESDDWIRSASEQTRAKLEDRPVDRSKMQRPNNRTNGPRVNAPTQITKPKL